ncbi:MAG: hypothetical protein ACOH2V_12975 [Candidatus Saccharimonadaceae bacterium]
MKSIKLILIATLVAFVSFAQAQKRIAISDVYDGKTVLQVAKDHAVEAFIATKSIYKDGMTESAFANECFKNFPKNYNDLKDVFMPYASYLYSFHKNGLSEEKVRTLVNGKEFVDCANGLLSWQQAHPAEDLDRLPWWRAAIHWTAVFFTWLDGVLS